MVIYFIFTKKKNVFVSIVYLLGHTEYVKMLIKLGANVNTQNSFGYTPLHWAVDNGKFQILLNFRSLHLKFINFEFK